MLVFFVNFSNDPCYFMFLNDGHFDGGHVSDELDESTSKIRLIGTSQGLILTLVEIEG